MMVSLILKIDVAEQWFFYVLWYYTESDDNDETEKTLALIIGVIAGVTLLIVFLSFLSKSSDSKGNSLLQHMQLLEMFDSYKIAQCLHSNSDG